MLHRVVLIAALDYAHQHTNALAVTVLWYASLLAMNYWLVQTGGQLLSHHAEPNSLRNALGPVRYWWAVAAITVVMSVCATSIWLGVYQAVISMSAKAG